MKRFSFLLCIAATLVFTSCEKKTIENTIRNPATDFQLKLSRTTTGGTTTYQVENALNQPGSANFTAGYYEKTSSVHLKIGGIQTTTVVPRLYADIHFKFTGVAKDIQGVYNFPADNDKIEFFLSENDRTTITIRSVPASGQLQVSYDPALRTVSGTISNLSYPQPLSSLYVAEVLNGKFSNVALAK